MMNKRIQELSHQARASVPKGILDVDAWIMKYNQIFAELIIRECAEIASNPAPGCHSSFGKIILERFGVDQ